MISFDKGLGFAIVRVKISRNIGVGYYVLGQCVGENVLAFFHPVKLGRDKDFLVDVTFIWC